MRKPFFAALLFCISLSAFAQNSMDEFRWYLKPNNQSVIVPLDDLNDEELRASTTLDWGYESLKGLELGREIMIAVIDGGFDIEHPELKNHVAYNDQECQSGNAIPVGDDLQDHDSNGYKGDCAGWDFVGNSNRPEDLDGHGTHVTGIMCSMLSGLKSGFSFLPLKVFAPNEGRETVPGVEPLSTRLNKAFKYAVQRGADVIHLSVGWPQSYMTQELSQTIQDAVEAGVIVVAAAGNSSQRAGIFPCQLKGVVCVGALRANGQLARFSNWGTQVDILAPGEKILSTIPYRLTPMQISRKGYDFKNGTSQSAPFISAALAVLKTLDTSAAAHETALARLMLTAQASPEKGAALKGMFQLEKGLKLPAQPLVLPNLKGLKTITLDDAGEFNFDITFKNYWQAMRRQGPVTLKCLAAQVSASARNIKLKASEEATLSFQGKVNDGVRELRCELSVAEQTIDLRLKVLKPLPTDKNSYDVEQPEAWITATRTGARSKLFTLNALKGFETQPLYYVPQDKKLTLLAVDKQLGTIDVGASCKFLRLWQGNMNGTPQNELMLESLCEDKFLVYRFFDQSLREIFPAVSYKPVLTIVNYDDFTLIPQTNAPPKMRFLGVGFATPPESPWDSPVSFKADHYYELFPVADGEHKWKYDVKMLERPDEWAKSLGLRFTPAYEVLHVVKGKLLIRMNRKTAWVDPQGPSAQWANLDHWLLVGSRKQALLGTDQDIFQTFLTPFEYRGHLLNGVLLSFSQRDRFDPLISVVGSWKNGRGYLSVVQSFQHLHYLQYDLSGKLIEQKKHTVERFDFLTSQELLASVVNIDSARSPIQISDGTRVNTQYVDVMKEHDSASFAIPVGCVSQLPVIHLGKAVLPVFCATTRTTLTMNFHQLD